MAHTAFRTCTLCESTCGLRLEVDENRIVSVRPDDEDVFSQGYACPKGIAIGEVRVRVTDEMRPGVVSLPHGWGHAPSAPWQRVAEANPGVSVNDWTDEQIVEPLVGQSILNAVPVQLRPANPHMLATDTSPAPSIQSSKT